MSGSTVDRICQNMAMFHHALSKAIKHRERECIFSGIIAKTEVVFIGILLAMGGGVLALLTSEWIGNDVVGYSFYRLTELGWVGVGLCFMGIAILVVGMISKESDTPRVRNDLKSPFGAGGQVVPAQAPPSQTGFYDCPNCKGPLKTDYLNCPNCSFPLKKKCPSCGQVVSYTWKTCAYCSHKFPED